MMVEQLRYSAPHIYDTIKAMLIGKNGAPDGSATGGVVRLAEDKYNATPGSFWYREMRPDDTFCGGGTAQTYSASYDSATEEQLLALAITENTVPTREMVACFGWYCDIDLKYNGYLSIKKFGVQKVLIPALFAWYQTDPTHYIFMLNNVMIGLQNEKFQFITYNGYGSIRTGIVWPLLYRIASRDALNLEVPTH